MDITGTIIVECQPVGGTSERTGNAWTAQTYVMEVTSGDHGQYKRKFAFEVFGEDRIKQFNLHQGMKVKVFFDIEANEYEGKWYNRVRAYAVESAVGQAQPYQPQPQPQQAYRPQPQQGGYQQRPPQNGFYQPIQQGYPQQPGYYQPQQPQGQPFPPQTDPVTGEPLPF